MFRSKMAQRRYTKFKKYIAVSEEDEEEMLLSKEERMIAEKLIMRRMKPCLVDILEDWTAYVKTACENRMERNGEQTAANVKVRYYFIVETESFYVTG